MHASELFLTDDHRVHDVLEMENKPTNETAFIAYYDDGAEQNAVMYEYIIYIIKELHQVIAIKRCHFIQNASKRLATATCNTKQNAIVSTRVGINRLQTYLVVNHLSYICWMMMKLFQQSIVVVGW